MNVSVYDRVLQYLANAYCNDIPTITSERAALSVLQEDIAQNCRDLQGKSYTEQQKYLGAIILQTSRFETKKLRKDQIDRMYFYLFADLVWHQLHGGEHWISSFQAIQNLSCADIDDSVQVFDLDKGPESLWVEWQKEPSSHLPRWISEVEALLICRLHAYDEPSRWHTSSSNRQTRTPFEDTLIRTLSEQRGEHNVECRAYSVLILRRQANGYSMNRILLQHEATASVNDMLALYGEVLSRDRHKLKQMCAVWANISIRLMLAHRLGTSSLPRTPIFNRDGDALKACSSQKNLSPFRMDL